MSSTRRLASTRMVATSLGHLAFLLVSGIQVGAALSALTRDPESPVMGRAWEDVRARVEAGHKLSDSFARQPEIFPPLVVMLARVGEETGELGLRLQRASELLARQAAHQARMRQALSTPVLTGVFSAVVLALLVKLILPRFAEMYVSLKLELPFLTRAAMAIVQVLNHPGFPALVLIAAALLLNHRAALRSWLFEVSLELPWTRELAGSLLSAQFCDVLASLYASGVPLNRALLLQEEAAGEESYARRLAAVRHQMEGGGSLATAVREELPFFPRSVSAMLEVGTQTGVLDRALDSVKRLLELEVDSRLQALQVALEPLLMAVLGVVLTAFFVAMMLPMYSMIGKLGF